MADNEQSFEKPMNEKQRKQKEQQELAAKRTHFLIAMLVMIVISVVGSFFICITRASNGWFALETVTVEGNTVYDEEQIITASGVVVGQSIFSVKTDRVEEQLLAAFPYYTDVDVKTVGMSEVHITVSETTPIGVIYDNGTWVTVGENGKAISREAIVSNKPKGQIYFKGTVAPKDGVILGKAAMDEQSQTVIDALLAAFEQYDLTDVIEIDLSDKSNIRLNWRGQLDVHIGNATDLDRMTHVIGMMAKSISSVLQIRGEDAVGKLDLTSYSNDELTDQGIFTPKSPYEVK